MDNYRHFRETEEVLSRLMPSCGREDFYEETCEMLERFERKQAGGKKRVSRLILAGGAMLMVGFAFIVTDEKPSSDGAESLTTKAEVLANTEYFEDVRDLGLFSDAEGRVIRRVDFKVIGERKLRDEETGIVFTVTEPREEAYLLTVNEF